MNNFVQIKNCKKCNKDFPRIEEFFFFNKNRKSWSTYCKLCSSRRRSEFKKKYPLRDRNNWLQNKYNINLLQYKLLLATQNKGCAICGRSNGKKWMAVDHDRACCPGPRSCGKCVRGLLCNSCNGGLGQFKDSSINLEQAILYLQNYMRESFLRKMIENKSFPEIESTYVAICGDSYSIKNCYSPKIPLFCSDCNKTHYYILDKRISFLSEEWILDDEADQSPL